MRDRADMLDEACGGDHRPVRPTSAPTSTAPHYRLQGAPLVPKPLQDPLPIMIGGRGERRTIPTLVRWGHEWNGWCSVADMRHFNALIDRLCDAAGRRPGHHRPLRGGHPAACATPRPRPPGCGSGRRSVPSWWGTPAQIVEQVADYAAAGTDELIVPDFNLAPEQTAETAELFMTEVAAAL